MICNLREVTEGVFPIRASAGNRISGIGPFYILGRNRQIASSFYSRLRLKKRGVDQPLTDFYVTDKNTLVITNNDQRT